MRNTRPKVVWFLRLVRADGRTSDIDNLREFREKIKATREAIRLNALANTVRRAEHYVVVERVYPAHSQESCELF